MNEIVKPHQITYFIAYDEDKMDPSYGKIDPEQVMTTGRSILYQTQSKEEWGSMLMEEFGIDVNTTESD